MMALPATTPQPGTCHLCIPALVSQLHVLGSKPHLLELRLLQIERFVS
eukprot:COSAG01_NODE_42144_length_443_cov_0.715116_1_plen_47_part_10